MFKRLVEFKKLVMRKWSDLQAWWCAPRLSLWTRLRIASLKKWGCPRDARALYDTNMISLIARDLDEDDGYVEDNIGLNVRLFGYLGSGRTTDPTKDFSYVPLNARSLTAFVSPQRAPAIDLNKNPGSACVVETSGLSGGFYQPPSGKEWSSQFEPDHA